MFAVYIGAEKPIDMFLILTISNSEDAKYYFYYSHTGPYKKAWETRYDCSWTDSC